MSRKPQIPNLRRGKVKWLLAGGVLSLGLTVAAGEKLIFSGGSDENSGRPPGKPVWEDGFELPPGAGSLDEATTIPWAPQTRGSLNPRQTKKLLEEYDKRKNWMFRSSTNPMGDDGDIAKAFGVREAGQTDAKAKGLIEKYFENKKPSQKEGEPSKSEEDKDKENPLLARERAGSNPLTWDRRDSFGLNRERTSPSSLLYGGGGTNSQGSSIFGSSQSVNSNPYFSGKGAKNPLTTNPIVFSAPSSLGGQLGSVSASAGGAPGNRFSRIDPQRDERAENFQKMLKPNQPVGLVENGNDPFGSLLGNDPTKRELNPIKGLESGETSRGSTSLLGSWGDREAGQPNAASAWGGTSRSIVGDELSSRPFGSSSISPSVKAPSASPGIQAPAPMLEWPNRNGF